VRPWHCEPPRYEQRDTTKSSSQTYWVGRVL